jgi:thioredoxin 2
LSQIHYVCAECGAVNRLEQSRLAASPKCGKCHQILITGQVVTLKAVPILISLSFRHDLPVMWSIFGRVGVKACQMMAPFTFC